MKIVFLSIAEFIQIMKYFNFRKILYLVLLFNIIGFQNINAQDNDYGSWTSLNFKKDLSKTLSASVGGEFRTRDKFNSINSYNVKAKLSYDVLPFLKAYFDYKYTNKKKLSEITKKNNYIPSYWSPRHSFRLSLKGEYEWNDFEFSLRERYQYTYQTSCSVEKYDREIGERIDNEYVDADSDNILRSRLHLKWNIKKNYKPFVSYELFNNLDDWGFKKTRFKLGVEYKLNKHNSIDVYYCHQNDRVDMNEHILGINYDIKF